MKKLLILTAAVAIIGGAAPTLARAEKASGPKGRLMEKYDLNHNGVIDGEEIQTIRKDFAADPKGELMRYDTNKNGKLDDDEIATMKPPGAKGKGSEKSKKEKPTKSTDAKETPETAK